MACERPPQQQQQQQQLWVFELCALGGVPISVHYTLVLLVFIQVFAATLSYHFNLYNALMFLLYGPIMFITVFFHELGHAYATRSFGGIVDRIVLWPLGGFTVFGSSNEAVADDLLIAVSGPLTHVLQGGLWVGIYALLQQGDMSGFSTSINLIQLSNGGAVEFMSILSSQAACINAGLFICNLAIPAYPLDGGRILAALLVLGDFTIGTTARITSVMGTLIGLLMLFIGVYWYVIQTSAGSLFLAIISLFVVHSGLQLWRAAAMNRLHEHPLFQLTCYRRRGGSRRPLTTSLSASSSPPREQTNINIV